MTNSHEDAVLPDPPESDPWQAAREFGIDVSLTQYLLTLTPTQRLERHEQALELVRALRAAGIAHYGFDPRHPSSTSAGER
ncbi:hypothetical protein RAS2_34770 [Phycisphaerae bacterium RAS2]|nr:hypothetical protein RAS2_34770 [Phycisphaerae bacterium RAS2]